MRCVFTCHCFGQAAKPTLLFGLCLLGKGSKQKQGSILNSLCHLQYLILGWSEYKANLLQQRVVQPLQNFLTQQLQVRTVPQRSH